MSDLIISGNPEDSNNAGNPDNSSEPESDSSQAAQPRDGHASQQGSPRSQRTRGKVPNENDCLEALAALPGLITMKMVSTSQANSMRGIFKTILDHHRKNAAHGDQPHLADDDFQTLLQTNPEMFNMLEPLLTDAQIDMIMRQEAKDGDEFET